MPRCTPVAPTLQMGRPGGGAESPVRNSWAASSGSRGLQLLPAPPRPPRAPLSQCRGLGELVVTCGWGPGLPWASRAGGAAPRLAGIYAPEIPGQEAFGTSWRRTGSSWSVVRARVQPEVRSPGVSPPSSTHIASGHGHSPLSSGPEARLRSLPQWGGSSLASQGQTELPLGSCAWPWRITCRDSLRPGMKAH